MKLSDFLKGLGIKTDGKEINGDLEVEMQEEKKDVTDKQALGEKGISINIISDKKTDNNDTPKKEDNNDKEEEEYMADLSKIKFENGRFSGLKTLTEKDAELKTLLESVNKYADDKDAESAINNAIKTELAKYQITEGISENVVLTSLNRNDIKYLDNKVLGVEDAFAALAKDNAGMLKLKSTDSNGNKDKSTEKKTVAEGPALEGFSKDMNTANPLSDTELVNYAFGND